MDPQSIPEAPYADEARKRWGNTDAYKESARRTKSYDKADWDRIKAELEGIERGFAEAMNDGEDPTGERALGLAESAREHIARWYYPCSATMHAALADMYVSDERFRAHYDDRAPGLAEWMSTAIKANAARA